MTNDKAERLLNYLIDGCRKGINNFTVSFQSDTHFIVHPESVDGETIDIHLNKDERVTIILNGEPHKVYPIVSYLQLKIMAGANNNGYKVVCENPPEHWDGKEPCEHEQIDLNMPHHGLYTFKIIRKYGTE